MIVTAAPVAPLPFKWTYPYSYSGAYHNLERQPKSIFYITHSIKLSIVEQVAETMLLFIDRININDLSLI